MFAPRSPSRSPTSRRPWRSPLRHGGDEGTVLVDAFAMTGVSCGNDNGGADAAAIRSARGSRLARGGGCSAGLGTVALPGRPTGLAGLRRTDPGGHPEGGVRHAGQGAWLPLHAGAVVVGGGVLAHARRGGGAADRHVPVFRRSGGAGRGRGA